MAPTSIVVPSAVASQSSLPKRTCPTGLHIVSTVPVSPTLMCMIGASAVAGASQAAKNAAESVIDASGAAAKAVALMAAGDVEIESTVAHVIPDLCSSCHTCVTACPYGAISMDTENDPPVAFVQEAKCKGCGTCSAACPSGAIVMYHSTDDQIMTMVEAYLCYTPEADGGGAA